VQFLVLAGNRFWFYILLMYLGYRTIQLWCCVSFFGIFFVVAGKWFWHEIGSFFFVAGKFYYDQKKKVPVICLAGCAVVSVFGSAGNWQFFSCGGKVLSRPEKKDTVVCLAGARSLLRP
jgi:hypothetical protein